MEPIMMLPNMPRPSFMPRLASSFAPALQSAALAPWQPPPRAQPQWANALAPATDLSALRGRRLIALIDCENVARDRDHGLWMNFKCLARALCAQTRATQLHAFFTEEAGGNRWARYFRERGYICHPHPVEVVHGRLRANSDPDLLYHAGRLLPGCGADTLLIASGDGDLVSDIARLARQSRRSITTVAMGLPGKTSSRLHKGRQHVDHCIMVGKDLLQQASPGTSASTASCTTPARTTPAISPPSRFILWR